MIDYAAIQTISWALFSLLFASFFTVLSITLNKPKISVPAYFKILEPFELLFQMSSSSLFLLWNLLIYYEYCSSFACVVFILGLIQMICFFIDQIIDMDIIANDDRLFSLLQPRVVSAIIKKKKSRKNPATTSEGYTENAILGFWIKCLNDVDEGNKKSVYSLFMKIIDSAGDSPETQKEILEFFFVNHNSFINEKTATYIDEDFAFFERCLLFSSDGRLKNLKYKVVLRKYFEVYRKWVLRKELHYSHILTIRDSLFFFFKYAKGKKIEDVVSVYEEALRNCSELVRYSMEYSSPKEIEEMLNDYCQIVQFLNMEPELNSIIGVFDSQIVLISTWIVALSLARRISADAFSYLIEPIVNHSRRIVFEDIEYFMYPEVLPPTEVHVVEYTQNYYICIVLIYLIARKCVSNPGSWLNDSRKMVCNKVLFDIEPRKRLTIEAEILANIKKIRKSGYFVDKDITEKVFEKGLNGLWDIINQEKTNDLIREVQRLNSTFDESKIRENIVLEFKKAGIMETSEESNIHYKITVDYLISSQEPINSPSYVDFIKPYLFSAYNMYDPYRNVNKELSFVSFLKDADSRLRFLIPYGIQDLISDRKIYDIETTEDGLNYYQRNTDNAKPFKFDFYRGDLIYDRNKVLDSIKIGNILFEERVMSHDNGFCSISVPVKISFSFFYKCEDIRYQITDAPNP